MKGSSEQQAFEMFLMKHVGRLRVVYAAVALVFLLCAVACMVMAVAAFIKLHSILKAIVLLFMGAGFVYSALGFRGTSNRYGNAKEEIMDALEDPEFIVPDDYSERTLQIRANTRRTLKSIKGLIISYAVLSVVLWAMVPVLLWASGVTGDFTFTPAIFLLGLLMAAMALPLTILTIAYIKGYAETMRFMPQILDK